MQCGNVSMTSSLRSEALCLKGRQLFITGGTGFLGRSLLDYLGESATLHGADFQATVLSRNPADFLQRFPEYADRHWLTFIEGDLQQLPPLHAGYTDVVHAAADTHFSGDDPLAWLEQLVDGTRRVLDYACAAGAQRLLLLSSGAVYGRQNLGQPALQEDLPQAPLSTDISALYAHGKRMAETLCALYTTQRGLPCVIARCFAVLSEHVPLDGQYAAGNFLRDALDPQREYIQVRGDGTAVRTYLDGRDLAHWTFTLLHHGVPGEAYNMGSDQPATMLELAQRIAHLLAPAKPVVVEHKVADEARSLYMPSIAKAQAMGLRAETTLEQSIIQAAYGIKQRSHLSNNRLDNPA